jgi:hypothetical protein
MNTTSDLLVKHSHRSLWLALGLLLVLGAYALILNLAPDSAVAAQAGRLAVLLPLAIVIALAVLRRKLGGISGDPAGKEMKAVLQDELRRQAMQQACRNGLLAVLVAQPVLALLLTLVTVAQPVLLMATVTGLLGVATVLGSILVLDR